MAAGDRVPAATGHSLGERVERYGKTSWWVLGILLLAILGFTLLERFGGFVIPALIGIVLATTLSPIVGWLQRHHIPRLLGAVLVTLVVAVLLIAFAWALVVIVADQSPQIWHTLQNAAGEIDKLLGRKGSSDNTFARLQLLAGSLQRGAASGFVPIAVAGVRELYALVVAVFLAAGFSFFFLWEGPDVRRWVSRHLTLPEDVGDAITGSLVRTTRRYVAGLSGIGAMEAVLVGATAAISGVAAWPLIALMIFIGNYIPYIGGLIAGLVGVLLALGSAGVGPAIAVLIAIVVAFFAGSHLGAFFIGGALRLPVTAVFVLTMAGAAVAGIFGAAAAGPLCRLYIDARDLVRTHREEVADYREHFGDEGGEGLGLAESRRQANGPPGSAHAE